MKQTRIQKLLVGQLSVALVFSFCKGGLLFASLGHNSKTILLLFLILLLLLNEVPAWYSGYEWAGQLSHAHTPPLCPPPCTAFFIFTLLFKWTIRSWLNPCLISRFVLHMYSHAVTNQLLMIYHVRVQMFSVKLYRASTIFTFFWILEFDFLSFIYQAH